ncbi:alkaline shock response membrane anchor protein AmaP [Nonomuraea typhae]|uniref:Alkaline shock response membrane anchor protein AmaP n=1 Tax=Nonomuraea typhae TaxID=2603600 RepID=A0ABW7YV24_9ACTN
MNAATRRGNRLGLALVGLLLTVLGGAAVARSLGLLPQTWAPAAEPLVNGPVIAFFSRPWAWWALAAGAVVLAVLALRWLFVQGRRATLSSLLLESGPGGVTEISANGVAEAVTAEIAAGPAVLSATAGLTGSPHAPEVRLSLVAGEGARIGEIKEHLAGVAIPHMRDALETDRLPAVARVTLKG